MNAARIRAALHAVGASPVDSSRIEHIARGTYRVRDGSRILACKLFDGRQAGERARTEGGAYAALAARGAPVPRLLALDEANAAIVREWVAGPTLAQALRGEAARPAWEQVSGAWDALLAALDAWTDAMDPARVRRAHSLRRSEVSEVAEALIGSGLLQQEDPAWKAAAEEIRQLADIIGSAAVRTVPLDLNPGNVILGPSGITFVDLEAFGLDSAEWSLCKATMLPHDSTSGRAGQALLAGQGDAPLPNTDSQFLAGALLLALADAAGLWRPEPAHPVGLTLVRRLCARTTIVPHLAAALV
ncbi:MAG: phosphotransferase [Chloroflexi bacterium]|nr:phosphotransferase [Chloroflexota bacterium]